MMLILGDFCQHIILHTEYSSTHIMQLFKLNFSK